MEVKGKKVFITGASKGIGYATAQELIKQGAIVFLTARSEEELATACQRLSQADTPAFYAGMDVASEESVCTVVKKAQAKLGNIDILINNAGITSQRMVSEQDFAQVEREIRVNYLGTFLVTRLVLPDMLRRRQGMIVNVSSTIGKVPSPTQANYCASKAAIIAFSSALRSEVEDQGVQVKVFIPGHTATEMTHALKLEAPQSMTPAEVAKHMLKAIQGRQPEYVCGGANQGIINLSRFFPEQARRIMKKIALKSFYAE